MLSIHIAEWILGLVTSRERAASTVGDLVEEAAARGVGWFWSAILRTAASLLWSGIAENPVRVTRLAFVGLVIDIVASLLLAGLTGVVFFVAAMTTGRHIQFSLWWTIGLDAPLLVVSLLIGRMLARWAPGRELCACVAYAILASVFDLMIMSVFLRGLAFSALLWTFLSDVAQRTPVLAGAVWGRYRRLAAR